MKKNKQNKTLLDWALYYRKIGWSPFPVKRNKKPFIEWKKYQSEIASEKQTREWWNKYPEANIGIATGKVSGIVVVDIEKGGSATGFPPTVTSKTGGGGIHLLYKYPNKPTKNSVKEIRELIDYRGDGGYIVVPPSLHLSGNKYEWEVPPNMEDFEELPQFVIDQSEKDYEKKDWATIATGVSEGQRNETATKYVGKLLHSLSPELWDTAGWGGIKEWNQRNTPPLPEKELRAVFESIATRESDKTENKRKFNPISISELMRKKFEDVDWTVEHLIPLGGTTAVSGSPAAFKTWFVLEMALKIAKGETLFNKFFTTKAGILVIDEESGERLLNKRLNKLNKTPELPIHFLSLQDFQLTKDKVEEIVEFTKKNNITVIILDSLVRIHGSDENDAMKMAGVFKHFKEFNKNGMSVIFTHHNRKESIFKGNPAQSMRGSSDILASVDCHLALANKKKKEGFITVTQTKNRLEEEITAFKLSVVSDENNFTFEYIGEVDDVETRKEDCKEMVKDILAEEELPMYKKELFESLKEANMQAGYSTFKEAIKEMVKEGHIFEKRGEKNKTYCSLKPFDSEIDGQNTLTI